MLLLTVVGTLATIAFAHPEDCGGKGEEDHGEGVEGLSLIEEELAALDDSEARLEVGEVEKKNIQHRANLPKAGPFAAEDAFNSDIAFSGDYAFQGNYNGIQITDVSQPKDPEIVNQITCPGSQNDVSVYGGLLFTSTDSSRNISACENNLPQDATIKESWEGIRIFDVSDPTAPSLVTTVETDCGSHTHTLLPDEETDRVLIYVQSYGPSPDFPDCQPPHDKISIINVPLDAPELAAVVNEPVLFPDGGEEGTSGCHDITVYQDIDLAAGACMGQGSMIDISDPLNPQVISNITDSNFVFWHSATSSNNGRKVVFTDELGGGGQPTCNPTIGPDRGADGIYNIADPTAHEFRSYFKIPRTNTNEENCVAHNGSLVPTRKRDIMIQAWYQGGISVVDFTDPRRPKELAYFDRGPLSDEELILGGSWSAYWYNGKIFSNDIQQGLDVFKFTEAERLGALKHKVPFLNTQTQERF